MCINKALGEYPELNFGPESHVGLLVEARELKAYPE
jgi:hypothetical protein